MRPRAGLHGPAERGAATWPVRHGPLEGEAELRWENGRALPVPALREFGTVKLHISPPPPGSRPLRGPRRGADRARGPGRACLASEDLHQQVGGQHV